MNVVTIIITGLALLVRPSSGTNFLNAFLVSADARPSYTDNAVAIPRHVAFIMFDMTELDRTFGRTTRQPNVQFLSNGITYGIVLLDGEVFTMEGVDAADTLQFDGDNGKLSQGSDRQPFTYVQTFNDICPKCAPNAKIVDPVVGNGLGAAFYFANGHVASTALGDAKWGFCDQAGDCAAGKDPNKDKPIALPQQVTVDMKLSGNDLLLVSHPRATKPNAKVPDDLMKDLANSLWFKAGASVMIGSAPIEDLLGLSNGTMEHVDRHFEHYYDLMNYQSSGTTDVMPMYIPSQQNGATKAAQMNLTSKAITKASGMPVNSVRPGEAFLHGSNCPPMTYVQP